MSEPTEEEVLARAKRTFIEKNHDDRAWDEAFTEREARQGHTVACLTDIERQEYLDQAAMNFAPVRRLSELTAARQAAGWSNS